MNSRINLRSTFLPLFWITSMFLTGCVTLYKPNAIHSPMLKEKGELKVSAALGALDCGLYNIDAAYAVSDHVGILMDAMYHTRSYSGGDSSLERLNIVAAEIGAGHFSTFGKQKNGLFQCYGGAGYGTAQDKIDLITGTDPVFESKYFNLFIQPGLGYINQNFEMAFDIRANYVKLFDIHASLYDQFEWWNTDFTYHSDLTLDFLLLEPTITIKAGGENLKGLFQLGGTIPAINPNAYFSVNNTTLFLAPLIKFAIGLNYSFGLKKKTDKN